MPDIYANTMIFPIFFRVNNIITNISIYKNLFRLHPRILSTLQVSAHEMDRNNWKPL